MPPYLRAMAIGLLLSATGSPVIAQATEFPDAEDFRLVFASDLTALLEQSRGQPVLINLWATWCTPCLKEIPVLIRLRENYRDRGLKLIAISMDDPADRDSLVIPFTLEHFPNFQTYQRGETEMDRLVSVIDPAWNEVLPTSYLITRDGQLHKVLFGGKSYEDFEQALLEVL